KSKRKSFSEIMEIYAFRIVVDSVDSCYRVLGCVHGLFKPVPGQFKDYIAIPKANGYQSLHTVLFGIHGVPIEIQIRTEEMEEMANNGIAAHWLYKTSAGEPAKHGSHARARRWVQGLLEMQQRAGNPLEFIENVKIDLFPDEVYVFTPRGDIFELPHGATAVDFAYAVHTDIGNSCVACRINRRLAPLSEPLESGQTVDIITSQGAQPNPAWLQFVATAKARANIRHFLKHQRQSEAAALGRRLLDRALNGLGSGIDQLSEAQRSALLKSTGHQSFDKVLEEIGLGNRVATLTAQQLLGEAGDNGADSKQPLAIRGTEGFVVNYAKCCYPIPGDPIVGHISAERGLVIHTENCHNSQEFRDKPERRMALRWAPDVDGDFTVQLRVELSRNRGNIATLATQITGLEADIRRITVEDETPGVSVVQLLIGVRSRVHLARVMKRVRHIKAVTRVSRVYR
ncbi:MAG: TGS domain-containing protein, partial [Spongiibacteraceae bacterium]|nr:TGS domain-containing protein [Spongiibacteraceae bacterium]